MGLDVATLSPVISVCKIAQRYTPEETLEYLLRLSDEEENAAPDEAVDDTSEEEDCTEFEPDLESEEEDLDEEAPVTFTSRNREILWSSSPPPQTQTQSTGRGGPQANPWTNQVCVCTSGVH